MFLTGHRQNRGSLKTAKFHHINLMITITTQCFFFFLYLIDHNKRTSRKQFAYPLNFTDGKRTRWLKTTETCVDNFNVEKIFPFFVSKKFDRRNIAFFWLKWNLLVSYRACKNANKIASPMKIKQSKNASNFVKVEF